MYRHSTKQHTKSQQWLREASIRSLNSPSQREKGSVYTQTYGQDLTKSSLYILNQVLTALSSNQSEAVADKRVYHTVCVWKHKLNIRIRCFLLQPEVVTAMAHTTSSNSDALKNAREEILRAYPAADRGRLSVYPSKCQIQGRIAPYVVDAAGLENSVVWSHCNISKSRIMFSLTTESVQKILALSRRSIDILAAYSPKGCAMVYSESTRSFKLTVKPEKGDASESPNKNSCILLYCDGSFKILGKVSSVHSLSVALKESILAVSCTQLWESFVSTLVDP